MAVAKKKYIPVDNSNFMTYVQTYAAGNYDQTRKYGPKNRWRKIDGLSYGERTEDTEPGTR